MTKRSSAETRVRPMSDVEARLIERLSVVRRQLIFLIQEGNNLTPTSLPVAAQSPSSSHLLGRRVVILRPALNVEPIVDRLKDL